MRQHFCVLAVAAFFAAVCLPAIAADDNPVLVSWYAALQGTDDADIASLLSDDAVIILEDIDIEQTKAEFVESLEEWRNAIDGGSVAFKTESSDENGATALVCYHFADGDMSVREVFTIAGGLITKSVQSHVADNCDGF